MVIFFSPADRRVDSHSEKRSSQMNQHYIAVEKGAKKNGGPAIPKILGNVKSSITISVDMQVRILLLSLVVSWCVCASDYPGLEPRKHISLGPGRPLSPNR